MTGRTRRVLPLALTLILLFTGFQVSLASLAAQETGTIRITFRGCPEGAINPFTNSLDTCTTPLDAPDAAVATWGEGATNRVTIAADAEREFDGTYVIDGIPANSTVWLRGFEPVSHNAFEIIGGDDTIPPDPWTAKVGMGPGSSRDLAVFYWNGEGGFSESGEGTLELTLRGCPDGVDPTTVDNAVTACTIPLDAPDDAGVIWGGDGQGGIPVPDLPRLADGTYHLEMAPTDRTITLVGFEPTVRNAFVIYGTDGIDGSGTYFLDLAPGETAHLYVYYYNE